jgi:hypothetical protein
MPATHHFNKSDCKHSFAYNEQGLMVFIEDAEDHLQYYLTPDKRVKLANKFNYKERQKHWAIVPEYIVINGERIRVDSDSYGESREHNEFKSKIFKSGWFYYKGHKVLLSDGKEEFYIQDSRFRADIIGFLHDGTQCIVEVIKSSDVSDKKKEYINDNQLLTFKIYIDGHGNQISANDRIIGVKRIEQIRERITGIKTELRLVEAETKATHRRRFNFEPDAEAKEISRRNRQAEQEISRLKNAIDSGDYKVKSNVDEEIRHVTAKISETERRIRECYKAARSEDEKSDDIRRRIERATAIIRSDKDRIEQIPTIINRYKIEIDRNRARSKELEKAFKSASKSCKPEWFGTGYINCINEYDHIKYWCD